MGQLITLWVFGAFGTFLAFIGFANSESILSIFLMVFIPFLLVFYTFGWKNKKTQLQSIPFLIFINFPQWVGERAGRDGLDHWASD